MVKLSTKGRYGTRAMLELALNYGRGPLFLKDIARRQEISSGYLEHIFPSLKRVGLINSTRGAHGGYTLAREPKTITLGQIIRAVEGDLSIVECVATPEVCSRVDSCVTRDIWEEISSKMMSFVDSITLQDMADRQKEKGTAQSLMYNI